MLPPNRRKTKANCEIDLREEFDRLVFGKDECLTHNHLILIRRPKKDEYGNSIKCICVSNLTGEADLENECRFCLGEGYVWEEKFSRCYSTLVGADGGKGNRNKDYSPGIIRTDYKIFYLRYDEKISYKDKIIELDLDLEGKLKVPFKRENMYRPETIQKYRSDNGRVEYIAVYCKEFNSIRENI